MQKEYTEIDPATQSKDAKDGLLNGSPSESDDLEHYKELPTPPSPFIKKEQKKEQKVEIIPDESNEEDHSEASKVNDTGNVTKDQEKIEGNPILKSLNFFGRRRQTPSTINSAEENSKVPQGVGQESYQHGQMNPEANLNSFVQNTNMFARTLRKALQRNTDITLKQVAKGVFSTVSGVLPLALFVTPVKSFAGENPAAFGIYITCSFVTNFIVYSYAGAGTFESFMKHIPDDEAREITKEGELGKRKALKVLRVMTASPLAITAALPYTLAADALWKQICVQIGNTISSYFVLDTYMFTHLGQLIAFITRSESDTAYKKLLATAIHSMKSIKYELIRTGQLDKIRHLMNTPEEKLIEEHAQLARGLRIKAYQPLSTSQIIGRRLLPAIGSMAIINGGLAIYVIKTFEAMQRNNPNADLANVPISAVISIPFLYLANVFAILLSKKIADALTCNGEKPTAFQLYPIQTLVALLTSTLIVSGSFAAIAGMILTDVHFGQSGVFSQLTTPAVIVGAIAAAGFNLFPTWDIDTYLVEESGLRFGSEENKDYIKYDRRVNAFETTLNTVMSKEVFLEAIDKFQPSEKAALLKMSDSRDNIQTLINTARKKPAPEQNLSVFANLGRNSQRLLGRLINEENDINELQNFNSMKSKHRSHYLHSKYGALPTTNEEIQEAQPQVSAWQRFKNCLPSVPTPHCPKITFFSNFSFTRKPQYEPIATEEENRGHFPPSLV